jgi:hypothetical protein
MNVGREVSSPSKKVQEGWARLDRVLRCCPDISLLLRFRFISPSFWDRASGQFVSIVRGEDKKDVRFSICYSKINEIPQ